MQKKILITSALPYANGPLHFGHIAGAYLPGDCYARYERLAKNDVLYICGSDEYGIAITISAEMAGRTPKEHVDIFHAINMEFFRRLNISFDHFSRTTWEGHHIPVQQFFLDLLANGFIEEKTTLQLFSEKEQRFLADRYVCGQCPKCGFHNARGDECPQCGASYEATDLINPRSKITGAELVLKETNHWFLMLDKLKEPLKEWISTKQWKPNVINFVKSYIDDVRPRAITRDSNWGVPVPLPNTEGKVLYVWFDAPIGYISATQEWAKKIASPDAWQKFWCDSETKLVNFIGKDNIPFHAVTFPAMVMGQNQPYKLVDELPANEFYKLEGRQFSKSDGWYIDLEEFFKYYSADQIRYAIAANAPETSDSEFTWKDFQQRCNGDLLGKIGNFINRVLVFIKTHCSQKMPFAAHKEDVDNDFLAKIYQCTTAAAESYATFKLRRASQLMVEIAQLGNVYFDTKKPWQAAKNPSLIDSMHATMACCIECIKLLALVAYPIIPETAEKIWKLLNLQPALVEMGWDAAVALEIPEGHTFNEPYVLFAKIDDSQIESEIAKLHSLSQQQQLKAKIDDSTQDHFSPEPLKEAVTIDDVRKLDLRVGIIKKAEVVKKSKKLLLLEVDIGLETRQIVSGIRQHYDPDSLIGKKVVVIANLKPAILMGMKSQGMLLAAGDDNALELLELNSSLPGFSIE